MLAVQRADGAIPWFRGHHLDPWDHTEAAMALDAAGEHEARRGARTSGWPGTRTPDGSWYAAYADGDAGRPTDRGRETNFCAYVAVGVWHHYLATGDDTFLDRMWPAVVRGRRVRAASSSSPAGRSAGSARPTARPSTTRC